MGIFLCRDISYKVGYIFLSFNRGNHSELLERGNSSISESSTTYTKTGAIVLSRCCKIIWHIEIILVYRKDKGPSKQGLCSKDFLLSLFFIQIKKTSVIMPSLGMSTTGLNSEILSWSSSNVE